MNKRCNIWFCFKKSYRGLQIEIAGKKQVVAWYCERHSRMADEAFKNKEIKTNIPIVDYKGLNL